MIQRTAPARLPVRYRIIKGRLVANAFCATGKGGGNDPTCGKGGAGAAPARAPGIGGRIAQAVSRRVVAKFHKLEARYGRAGAIAVMAGIVATLPAPVPGSSLAIIAAAEGIRAGVRLVQRLHGHPASPAAVPVAANVSATSEDPDVETMIDEAHALVADAHREHGAPLPATFTREVLGDAVRGHLYATVNADDNCGTGAGGFKPGNRCSTGAGSTAVKANDVDSRPSVQEFMAMMERTESDDPRHTEIGNAITDENKKVLIERGGKLAAAASYKVSRTGAVELIQLGSVDKGGGKEAVDTLKRMNRRIIARTVRDEARGFYEKQGFRTYAGHDMIWQPATVANETPSLRGMTAWLEDNLSPTLTRAESRRVAREILQGIENEDNPETVAARIAEVADVDDARAQAIAQTEMARIQREGQLDVLEENQGAEAVVRWKAHKGACPECLDNDGEEYTVEEARGVLPAHPHCVTGDSEIRADDVKAILKANFTGEVVEFTTTNGRRFTVTINHILLTEHGLLAARDIHEGTHVIDASFANERSFNGPNNNDAVSVIANVFASFSKTTFVSTDKVPTAAEDLHGDGASVDGEVEVIWPNRELRNETEGTSDKSSEHTLMSTQFVEGRRFLNPPGLGAKLLERVAFAADRSMGRSRDALALANGRALPTQLRSGLSIPLISPRLLEAAVDDAARTPESLSDMVDRSSFVKELNDLLGRYGKSVVLDRITSAVHRHVVDLPVYDVQTQSTLYSLNGVVSSNCYCRWVRVRGSVANAGRGVNNAAARAIMSHGPTLVARYGVDGARAVLTAVAGVLPVPTPGAPRGTLETTAGIRAGAAEALRTLNMFCRTGPGGGVDPTCGKGDSGAGDTDHAALAKADAAWEDYGFASTVKAISMGKDPGDVDANGQKIDDAYRAEATKAAEVLQHAAEQGKIKTDDFKGVWRAEFLEPGVNVKDAFKRGDIYETKALTAVATAREFATKYHDPQFAGFPTEEEYLKGYGGEGKDVPTKVMLNFQENVTKGGDGRETVTGYNLKHTGLPEAIIPRGVRYKVSRVEKVNDHSYVVTLYNNGKLRHAFQQVADKNKTGNVSAVTSNMFCPTGHGGGIDPTCGKGDGGTAPSGRGELFDRWFAGSKVVDAAGKPLVVYHGTGAYFTEFSPTKIGARDNGYLGRGFYFSSDPNIGSAYATLSPGDSQVIPAFLRIRNPYPATERLSAPTREQAEAFTRDLIKRGYDGAVHTFKDGTREYVAFDPRQVKSATAAQRFDPTSPDIRNVSAMVNDAYDIVANLHAAAKVTVDPRFSKPALYAALTANVFCRTGEGGGIDPTCSPGGGGGGSGDTAGKTDLEKVMSVEKLAPRGRAKAVLAEAEKVNITDELVVGEPVLRSDYDEIENRLTREERRALDDQLNEFESEMIDSEMADFDPNDHISHLDMWQAASEAGWGDEDVADKAKEEISGLSLPDNVKTKAEEVIDAWREGTDKYGDVAVSDLAHQLRVAFTPLDPAGSKETANKIADAVAGLEDKAREETESEIQALRDRVEQNHRENLVGSIDLSPSYHELLKDFYDNHEERFTAPVVHNTWGKDGGGDRAYAFTTSAGNNYDIWTQKQTIQGEPVLEMGFRDENGSHAITGAGGAHEVFSNVVTAITALALKEKPPAMSFTAAESSRQKLYDRLVRTTASAAPDYMAVAIPIGEHGRRYVLVRRDSLSKYSKIAQDLGNGVRTEVLVNEARWQLLHATVDPRWFTPGGWDFIEVPGPESKPTLNMFCPTGEGGGVDPSCGKSGEAGSSGAHLEKHLNDLRGEFIKAAQEEYDAWQQDEEGMDEECGAGGICDVISRRIAEVISENINDAELFDGGQDGDDHAWTVVKVGDKAYGVDIAPSVYESGGGYHWTKTPGVTFKPHDIDIFKVDAGDFTNNAFCPTGAGGGVDPSCGKDGTAGARLPYSEISIRSDSIWGRASYGTSEQNLARSVTVYKNASREQLKNLLRNIDPNEVTVKGMVDSDGNSYAWEVPLGAEGMSHGRFSELHLGTTVPLSSRYYVIRGEDGQPIVTTHMGPEKSPAVRGWAEKNGIAINAFCATGVGGGIDPTCSPSGGSGVGKAPPGTKGSGTREDPYRVGGDIELAARLLAAGNHVRLKQPDQVATLLDEMQRLVTEAVAKGAAAPNFDLCNVSVKGTNLFCQDNLGIPRVDMPQLKGSPVPGSPAAAGKLNKKGEADLSADFIRYLRDRGVETEDTKVHASHLRASQREIVGAKVAALVEDANAGRKDIRAKPIFVTRDNYVLDGHHHWAAIVGLGAGRGKDLRLRVHKLDMEIGEAIAEANAFTRRMGIRPKVANMFCPTGEGGGIDPTCGKSSGGGLAVDTGTTGVSVDKAKEALAAVFNRPWGDETANNAARWRYTLEKVREGFGEKVYVFSVNPVKEPTQDPSSGQDEIDEKPGMTYRGMSHEEWEASVRSGGLRSAGSHNLTGEEGLTFYGDAQTAEVYANGFAPVAFKPSVDRPGVVVEIPQTETMGHEQLSKIPHGERAHKGSVSLSKISRRWELRPVKIKPGHLEVVEDRGKFSEGSRSNPSVTHRLFPVSPTSNAFCPTGKGGGQDPTCSPKNKGKTIDEHRAHRAAKLVGGASTAVLGRLEHTKEYAKAGHETVLVTKHWSIHLNDHYIKQIAEKKLPVKFAHPVGRGHLTVDVYHPGEGKIVRRSTVLHREILALKQAGYKFIFNDQRQIVGMEP